MGHIKEPKGIDFLIQSPPLTDKEREEISELIIKMKAKSLRQRIGKKKKTDREMAE